MLISPAYAADPAPQDPIMGMLPIVLMFIALWFLLIRPQMKKAKEQQKMQGALQKGDEVVTASGQLGKVVKVSDQFVTLDIGGGVETVYQRGAIGTLLPKGTIKDI